MLGVVGSSLKMVKFEPTTPNTSQHVATGWPNARNMLRPTMLRHVALACCDRLAGASCLSPQFVCYFLYRFIIVINVIPKINRQLSNDLEFNRKP